MDARDRIVEGIKNGVNRHWRYTKNLLQIKPEYLLTISVADSITDGIGDICGLDLTIKLEEPTRSICYNLLSNAVGLREYFKKDRHKVSRRGKVDIFVENDKDCWIIELKGFDPSTVEINKDIVRLVEFLSANNWINKCKGAYLAFPTLIDQRVRIERLIDGQIGGDHAVIADVHALRVETDEDPEDGIPVYYANCISLSVRPPVGP